MHVVIVMLTPCAVLEDRKVHPVEKKDILSMMVEGRDKETGLGMSEENIKYNVRRHLSASFQGLPLLIAVDVPHRR